MKFLNLIFTFLISTVICSGQGGEFKIYSNGLMYHDTTMKKLEKIVDSLNLKFKVCELNKTYYSKYQAKAHYVSLSKGNIKQAKKDLKNNLSFADFNKKYPKATIKKDLLVVKYQYQDYEKKDVVEFSSLLSNYEIKFEKKDKEHQQPLKGKWLFNYQKKSDYSEESISAFYFIEEMEKKPLALPFARLVQYSDCLVDTSTQIFTENADWGGVNYQSKNLSSVANFLQYIAEKTQKPEYEENNSEEYYKKIRIWDSTKLEQIELELLSKEEFHKKLKKAVKAALNNGGSNDEFEEYVGKYYSKATELELKRGRRVIGGCSMDNSPRIHALNIAVLSAETVNWETFLRSHLDIMNDRFQRDSDGSYAWEKRETYIKELEDLDINVSDLILGITLRIENPSENHYYGNISRLGRALAEAKNSTEIEAKMLRMIEDSSLDDYNRILIYYLFDNYNYFLKDKKRKSKNSKLLQNAIEKLPNYLAEQIEIKK